MKQASNSGFRLDALIIIDPQATSFLGQGPDLQLLGAIEDHKEPGTASNSR